MNADEVTFEAVRLKHRAASLKLDRTGRYINPSRQGNQDIKRYYSPMKLEPGSSVASPSRDKSSVSHPTRSKCLQSARFLTPWVQSDGPRGKSLWSGRNGEVLTVEELALQHYEEQGFKGFAPTLPISSRCLIIIH